RQRREPASDGEDRRAAAASFVSFPQAAVTSMLSRAQQLDLVEKAARAPSPHNIQPARWRFIGNEAQLFECASRWLTIGDPSGRDNRIALGMAWEGMSLALSTAGFFLEEPELCEVRY